MENRYGKTPESREEEITVEIECAAEDCTFSMQGSKYKDQKNQMIPPYTSEMLLYHHHATRKSGPFGHFESGHVNYRVFRNGQNIGTFVRNDTIGVFTPNKI